MALIAAVCSCALAANKTAAEPKVETTKIEKQMLKIREMHKAKKAAQMSIPQKTYLGRYKITGYDTCAKCCGKSDGITASGTTATAGRTCAMKNVPFGTKIYIEGIGERIVEDRGGFASNVIDVLCENHSACYAITGYYDVYIIN